MSVFRRRGGTIPAHEPAGDEVRVDLSDGRVWPGVPLRELSNDDKLTIWEADVDGYFAAAWREARADVEARMAGREARRRAAFWAHVRRVFAPWRKHTGTSGGLGE